MFSGIVEAIGHVRAVAGTPSGTRLSIRSTFAGLGLGESISVSGVCLTAIAFSADGFDVDVSAETLRRSKLGRLAVGDAVNLERSLRLGDRLSGHLVFGHVDGIGTLRSKAPEGDSLLCRFDAPAAVARYLVEKGSVAVDGVSLTVFDCREGEFTVAIIPHTAQVTTLGNLSVGAAVNLESDMLARYVEKLIGAYRS